MIMFAMYHNVIHKIKPERAFCLILKLTFGNPVLTILVQRSARIDAMSRFTVLPAIAVLFLSACTEPVSTSGMLAQEASPPPLAIEVLSTRPWLVTGGDVLVEVRLTDADQSLRQGSLRIELNGGDVSSSFRQTEEGVMQALLEGLPEGDSELRAALPGVAEAARLTITNWPNSGPIISGPHEAPFYCETGEFRTVAGNLLGEPLDRLCSVATRVDYVYWSEPEQAFKPYQPDGLQPQDLAQITSRGRSIPYIVRVETGTVNRAIYEIAMLHDPAQGEPGPWQRSNGWNGKLVYTHGGGCRGGWYRQGARTGGVMRRGLFEQGYAVASSSLNVFGQNCNDLLASETHIMVKERFIEGYGVPVYTIATGASGGSYQSHQTADNYPGVFDGIIVSASFPDVTSATIFTVADARLLHHYFEEISPEEFSLEQQQAVSGFGAWASIANLSRGAARLDPIFEPDALPEDQGGEVGLDELRTILYRPGQGGIRATVYDHTVNVYGENPAGHALRPLDNYGVQYGLAAFNSGQISARQFIDLNRDIGGFDRDLNHVFERHRADPLARRHAIESGRILHGGGGLANIPIIDYRSYTDHAEDGDIHMIVHQFSTRERLRLANGNARNHVMQIGGQWGFEAGGDDLGELFRQMDEWILSIQRDESPMPADLVVAANRPTRLNDACWDTTGPERLRIEEELSYTGEGRCGELYPVYPTPRHVAGAPLANNIVSCHLRPLNRDEYRQPLTGREWAELQMTFTDGVCDWNRGDAGGAQYQGTWLSFGPSPVNRLN